jgi:peptide/nickel transport system substrate-binding protein
MSMMRRRDLLKVAAAATLAGGLAPNIGRAQSTKPLRYVGVADLSVLDPVVTGARPTRNAAYLIFDTLYGLDTEWRAQPQMVAGHSVENDGLVWNLTVRDGLRFHDGEPVLAKDVVASIRRFAPRVIFATALMDATDDLSAPDDKTVRFRLKRRFPHLAEALAGPGGNAPVIMPERLAQESPFKPVSEVIGSGPFRFLKDEHVSGARAVFARFAEYRPRDGSKVGFTAGPKVVHFDRVEWLTLDPFSAEAALRKGEIDWWENPSRDLVDRVTGDPNITVVSHFATANGIMTFNQLHPPFNNPAIRRALLGAIDQSEAISTIAGADHDNWHDGIGLFGAGTPFATDVGIEVLQGPRDYAKVKRALAEAGYNGERVIVMAPTDVHELGDLTRTGAEQLRRAGMNVDLQEMDFGSVIRRRANQGPPDKGGYNMFCTLVDRSLPNIHPFGHIAIRADGKEPINGWANSPNIEELRAAWLATADPGEQKRLCIEVQKRLWDDVPFIPLGEYWQASAYRKDVIDVIPGCFTTFYGVRRT